MQIHGHCANAKDLLRYSSGQHMIQAVLDSPIVQPSRSLGVAKHLLKHVVFDVARLRMARRGDEIDH